MTAVLYPVAIVLGALIVIIAPFPLIGLAISRRRGAPARRAARYAKLIKEHVIVKAGAGAADSDAAAGALGEELDWAARFDLLGATLRTATRQHLGAIDAALTAFEAPHVLAGTDIRVGRARPATGPIIVQPSVKSALTHLRGGWYEPITAHSHGALTGDTGMFSTAELFKLLDAEAVTT